jgi:tetratricopeptide (TPR) repeat protein
LSNISIHRPAWARGRRSITIFLGFCLVVALLLLQEPLLSHWHQNLGYLELSRALLLGGDGGLLKARASFIEAQTWQGDNPSALWGLGQAYYHLGDEEAAVQAWQKSERSLPLLLSSSDAAFNRQDYPLALDLALLAQRLDPSSSSVAYRLGEAYRATGELDRALEEYERAKEYNAFLPGDEGDLASCYFGQARVYEVLKNWEAAIWHYEAGLRLRADVAAEAGLASIEGRQ